MGGGRRVRNSAGGGIHERVSAVDGTRMVGTGEVGVELGVEVGVELAGVMVRLAI